MLRRHGLIYGAFCAFALLLTAAAGSDAQEPDSGERILEKSCQNCHDTRRIHIQAKSSEEWNKTVADMMAKGAVVAKEDVPVLVGYLTQTHGPLPNGPGKEVLLNTCTMCHDLKRIKLGRRSPEEWEETLGSMLNEGAMLSDDEFNRVHHYLSRNFGVE
jgi:cytochrome c5